VQITVTDQFCWRCVHRCELWPVGDQKRPQKTKRDCDYSGLRNSSA